MEWRVLEPGEVFEERYRIESVLGVGGFAHVYRATQMDLDRDVALKILRPAKNAGGGPGQEKVLDTWTQRFRREAKLISRLRDPHTITMFDFGSTDAEMSYMVFEYVAGRSLDHVIRDEGSFEPKRVVEILRQCLLSVQEAHSLGVLHRDLKPANILIFEHVGRGNRVKVLDFGIAKPMMDEASGHMTGADLTMDGTILGTPRYMAPEQLKGEPMGPGSDIYSLGLVAFEMLAGEKAISGNSTMTVISKQLSPEPIVLPADMRLPGRFRAIVHKMLTKDASRRYQTAKEVLDDLEGWANDGDLEGGATIQLGANEIELLGDDSGPTQIMATQGQAAEAPAPRAPAPVPATAPAAASSESAGSEGKSSSNLRLPLFLVAGLLVVVVILAFFVSKEEPGHDESLAQAMVAEPEPAVEPEVHRVQIRTEPAGASVIIDGVYVGLSPVAMNLTEGDFPVTIAVLLEDGRRADEVLEGPRETVYLELVAPQPEAETEVAADAEREEELRERQAAELRAAQQRAAEQRAAEQRAAEQRAEEERPSEEELAAQQRAAEQRAAEQRAAEQRRAEERRLAEERRRREEAEAAKESESGGGGGFFSLD